MAQQILDFPIATGRECAVGGVPNRREPAAPELIPGWRCLTDAIIRAHGEEGPVDVVALKPDRGMALVGFLEEGEQASPEEARDALRTMLRDEGFDQRFAGELPIVALALLRSARSQLAAAVERAFTGRPAPTVPSDWVDWVAERLRRPLPPAEPAPSLVTSRRDEPQPDKTAAQVPLLAPERSECLPERPAEGSGLLMLAPAEAPPRSDAGRRQGWQEWGAMLGFASGIVAALVAGLVAVLRNGRLF